MISQNHKCYRYVEQSSRVIFFQLAVIFLLSWMLPAWSQTTRDTPTSKTPLLSCKAICSPFEPRQSLIEVRWLDKPQEVKNIAASNLRLDIIGGASRFQDGNYGTVRISDIPIIDAQRNADIDLKSVRKQLKPTLIQKVQDNKVITRSPDLPSPEVLKKERIPNALPRLSLATKEAMKLDLKEGGFGRMQVIGQSIKQIKSVPHRNLILEGLQPGTTYKLRLVNEQSVSEADSIEESICRIPVCPADFKYSP